MAISATRQMLFAIISSMEEDLRQLVLLHLPVAEEPTHILDAELFKRAVDRYMKDTGDDAPPGDGALLMSYTDIGDTLGILNRFSIDLPPELAKKVKRLAPQIQNLVPIRNRAYHTRPLDYADLPTTLDLAGSLAKGPDAFWLELRDTMAEIERNPAFVSELRIPRYWAPEDDVLQNLPTPDFDETGFVGREEEVAAVRKAILGPYPVVSVVGEGGIGKTAVALKAAWDILDQRAGKFEAIIWATAKAEMLSGPEIRRIGTAIEDALGLMSDVSGELGGQGEGDPFKEVLDYLGEFRILLVLDNLETVLGEEMRCFLGHLPAGSKVVLTSRIGVGAYDYPIKLLGMSPGDSVQLLRSLCEVRRVESLHKMSSKKLRRYCKRMSFNPGFMKWFVAGVQSGLRPEDILARPDSFLDFCLSNVYRHLGSQATEILKALVAINEPHSQAALAYLSGLDKDQLQAGLAQLVGTSMVHMHNTPVGASYVTTYLVADLARKFLATHHALDEPGHRRLQQKRRQMLAMKEEIMAVGAERPYAIDAIQMRTKDDVFLASMLRQALKRCRVGDQAEARKMAADAKSHDPGYAEASKVCAFVAAQGKDFGEAEKQYEAAVELQPDSAPARFFFGGFLLRYRDDLERAIEQLEEARRLDSDAEEIMLELARAYLYSHRFDEAEKMADSIQAAGPRTEKTRRILADLTLQIPGRRAEYAAGRSDVALAVASLEVMRSRFEALGQEVRDWKVMETLAKKAPAAGQCERLAARVFGHEHDLAKRARGLKLWFDWYAPSVRHSTLDEVACDEGGRLHGMVQRLQPDRPFGYIRAADAKRYFFHRNHLREPSEWRLCGIGSRVSFSLGTNDRGVCAVDVAITS